MDTILLKNLLSRLSRHAFENFVVDLFNYYYDDEDPDENLVAIPNAGEGVYYQGLLDSYGGSLHKVFLVHFLPLELFKTFKPESVVDEELSQRLKKVYEIYKGQIGYWGIVSEYLRKATKLQSLGFITNIHNIERDIYDNVIIPQYKKAADRARLRKFIVVGSYDSFIDLVPEKTEIVFKSFILKNTEGLYISFEDERFNVSRFISERNIACGVLRKSYLPYEPIIPVLSSGQDTAINEFQELIRKETPEAELEKFIIAHYNDIFGPKYDRVETQLWLKFPELDIAGKERRLDIFLRNSVINDWELFEVKRVVNLTHTYRDAPVLAREVSYSIQQIKNYSKTLQQDTVRRYFAEQGIEYYHPSLNIIVGKTPQIPHEQWRYLLAVNERDVKILTFDNLLEEMKLRLNDRFNAGII